jgi:hypothetical protein
MYTTCEEGTPNTKTQNHCSAHRHDLYNPSTSIYIYIVGTAKEMQTTELENQAPNIANKEEKAYGSPKRQN